MRPARRSGGAALLLCARRATPFFPLTIQTRRGAQPLWNANEYE